MSQVSQVKEKINELIDSGITDKERIYSIIEKETNLPRPTIRRASSELVKDLKKRVEILKPLSDGRPHLVTA